MEKTGRVFVVGDIHGNPSLTSSKNWPESKELGPQDVIIFLGDFGLFWKEPMSKQEFNWLKWLTEKSFQVCFIDGNHENFNLLEQLPQEKAFDGNVGVYRLPEGKIYHLKRGEIYYINNKKILTIGGALSIDKMYRTVGRSWWPQELLSKGEENNTLDNLDDIGWEVDYVLTHTCPSYIIPEFLDGMYMPKYNDPVSRFLEFIDNRLEFKEWHFGHMHTDRIYDNGDFYCCHYYKIGELK